MDSPNSLRYDHAFPVSSCEMLKNEQFENFLLNECGILYRLEMRKNLNLILNKHWDKIIQD